MWKSHVGACQMVRVEMPDILLQSTRVLGSIFPAGHPVTFSTPVLAGYIINIGSQAGLHASKGNAAYAASKWGM